jgi:hypothetical protein
VREVLHLSPLVEVCALVAVLSFVPLDLVGPVRGVQVAFTDAESLALACKPPIAAFLVTPTFVQHADWLGCPVGPRVPHSEWPHALEQIHEDFESAFSSVLIVDDAVEAAHLIALVDVSIGAGFPAVAIIPNAGCARPHVSRVEP